MTGRFPGARGPLALTVLAAGLTMGLTSARPAQASEGGLQPYQMVRSLQLVQDRIAGGDHAALPMQKKLLELIDARFMKAGSEEFEDRRNYHALLIYAMSGGNPSTIADMLARARVEEAERDVGAAILGYLLGDISQSRAALGRVVPRDHSPEVAAFLFLVKGSVVAIDKPEIGISMLDEARLLSPGTLVEEAALRRTVALAATAGLAEKFLFAAEQYARRYLRSPYSSQFAESFVSGIIELRSRIELERIDETIAWMTAEQARTVYLRLARRAAIEGDAEMLAFASAKSAGYADAGEDVADPRSELYSGISSVTSETVEQVLERLKGLDTSTLSATDRALLTAAKAVAAEVVAPVDTRFIPPAPEPAGEDAGAPAGDARLAAARAKLDAVDELLMETQK